ncbi:PAS domain-containing sensor histidine kinase [Lucifera butyrica]|uniref:PAS domain-containing sensor histidine kinase n=1 Tax=Lucifera butyrica TaxID=1351585 RepID=UPI00140331E7|nr:PAS domain-containing sensor histidine kinase [Lucifera butyrica]
MDLNKSLQFLAPISKNSTCSKTKKNSYTDTLQAFFYKTTLGVALFDKELRCQMINPAAEKVVGRLCYELIGFSHKDMLANFLSPQTADELSSKFEHTLMTGNSCRLSIKLQRRDLFYIDCEITRILVPDEEVPGILFILTDITAQKQTLQELAKYKVDLETRIEQRTVKLREAHQQIYDILESISDGFFVLNAERRFTYVNQIIASLHSSRNLLGQKIEEVFFGDHRRFFEDCAKAADQHEPVRYEGYWEFGRRWFDMTIYPLADGAVAVYVRDITEQKKLQDELARLDRLNLVGQMAAGISHEIRNPMTTVRGYLQMLSTKTELTQFLPQFQLMIEELDRANQIITEFLSLAKNKSLERSPCQLDDLVRSLLPLLESDARISGQNIAATLIKVPPLLLDQKEIRQLILNLVRNGFDAMAAGGLLTLFTYVENDTVVLAVKDQGTGIPPDIVANIGTPFITTKDNGTGLGLAICFSIAERHNAIIDFETSSNGTTIYIRFASHQPN